MRKGFGLIQVILFMTILSVILAISMKYASISIKQTEDIYVREQAQLFMQSAIELTLLGLSSHDHDNDGYIETVRVVSDDKRFIADINLTDYFLFNKTGGRIESIDTEASNGMVSMQIVVETNSTHPKNSHPLKLTKRSLQRI